MHEAKKLFENSTPKNLPKIQNGTISISLIFKHGKNMKITILPKSTLIH